jgi:hypothetical protein
LSESERSVVRDAAWVTREYGEEKWARMLAEARRLLLDGEDSLARAVAGLNAFQRGEPGIESKEIVLLGGRVQVPAALAYDGLYATVARRLQRLGGDADVVLELGCGWGRSLFELWLGGGPRRARYCAGEFTAAGRECAALLAGLEPALSLEVFAFDFHQPAYPAAARGRKLLVYTLHAIEQAPILRAEAVDGLLALAEEVVGFHLEPVGWQLRPAGSAEAAAGEAYARRHDYNRNLVELLREFEAAGRISIERALPDFAGVNPNNPGALIEWRKRA